MEGLPLRFGPVELRPQERRLLVDGQAQALGARAFDLLLILVELRERVVTKRELLERVWPDLVVEESNLPVHVSALRKLLGPAAIATIPGRGYRFTLASADPSDPPDPPDPASRRPAAPPPPDGPAASSALPSGRFDQAVDPDPLIGREEAVYEVVAALLERRLVTLVGAGGIGKTRLARAVQRRLREDFVDGVWWVDLAPLRQAEQVPRAIAQALGEPFGAGDAADAGQAGTASARALAQALAHRPRMLLLLDNCEQVLAGVAQAVTALLAELPTLRLLLTSRVPLHLPAEQVWRLDALAVPEVGATLEQARGCGAFELLERRAQARHQRFVIDAAQLPAAIALCRRLEGHPLAIEMAAARVPQLGLAPLLDRLGDRLRLLRASDPARPDRQANLRALLDWSGSQLDDTQRAVLRRLAVFAGSFGLDAAQQVAADESLDEWGALDALSALVDHSLVQAHWPAGSVRTGPADDAPGLEPPRYRLPETTRLYALELLEAADEAPRTRGRLQLAMARIADEAAEAWWRLTQADWLRRFAADRDDLQAVFDAACAQDDAEVAAHTGQALQALDAALGSAAGARERAAAARRLLPASGNARTTALLWNLIAPPWTPEQATQTPPEEAESRAEAWRRAGDARGHYLALRDLARSLARADRAQAAGAAAEAMAALEDPAWGPALRCEGVQLQAELPVDVQADLPVHLQAPGGGDLADRALRRALALAEQTGDAWRVAWLRGLLAAAATADGRVEAALRLGEQATRALETLHRPVVLGGAWSTLCAAQLFAGDLEAARQSAAEAFARLHAAGRGPALFAHLALIEAHAGHVDAARRLLAQAEPDASGPIQWVNRAVAARLRHLAHEAIGPDGVGPADASLDDEQATELAWAALGGREAVQSRC